MGTGVLMLLGGEVRTQAVPARISSVHGACSQPQAVPTRISSAHGECSQPQAVPIATCISSCGDWLGLCFDCCFRKAIQVLV